MQPDSKFWSEMFSTYQIRSAEGTESYCLEEGMIAVENKDQWKTHESKKNTIPSEHHMSQGTKHFSCVEV